MVVVFLGALSRNSNGAHVFLHPKIVNSVGPPFCWTPNFEFQIHRSPSINGHQSLSADLPSLPPPSLDQDLCTGRSLQSPPLSFQVASAEE